MDTAEARTAFLEGRGVFVSECAVIWVEGPDAERFLQGLLTNDVALQAGQSCPSLLLDDKGHIQAGMTVLRDGPEAYTLVLESSVGEKIAELLHEFHFSEELEILGPELAGRITLKRGLSNPKVEVRAVGRLPDSEEWILTDTQAFLAENDFESLSGEVFHILRVENGVPQIGVDTNDRNLVQEAGLEDLTVSFSKGCYLGQETVARLQHRGAARKVLRGLKSGSTLSPGVEVVADKPVGTLTSAAESPEFGHIGLAILRTDAKPGDEVHVVGQSATVVELPFTQ